MQVVPLPFDDAQLPQPPLQAAVDAAFGSGSGSSSSSGSGGGSPADPLEVVELRNLPFRAYAGRLPDRWVAMHGWAFLGWHGSSCVYGGLLQHVLLACFSLLL